MGEVRSGISELHPLSHQQGTPVCTPDPQGASQLSPQCCVQHPNRTCWAHGSRAMTC